MRFRKMTGRTAVVLASVLAVGALAACSPEESPSMKTKTQAVTEGSPYEQFAFGVLDRAMEQGVALSATEWIELGDRAQVSEGSEPGGLSNSGSGIVRVGTDAEVGSIWAAGTVDLRDRAQVSGSVFVSEASAVSQGNQVTIASGIEAGDLGGSHEIYDEAPDYEHVGGDVRLEPDEVQTLVPGHYGELVVKSRSKLFLQVGDYSFSRVHVENDGELHLPAQCELSRLRVREALFFRGKVIAPSGSDALRLAVAYDGTQTAHIEQPFSGAIIAPNAELILSSHRHEGRFFAKRLRVQSNAEIVGREILECRGGGPTTTLPVAEPTDLGPAPPLATVSDLGPFLAWFYRIRRSELEEARGAISAISSQPEFVSAIMDRFEVAREQRSFGKALMLLELVGIMQAGEAETALLNLLQEPIAFEPGPRDSDTRYDDEVAYRRRAIFNLSERGTPAAQAAIESAAFGHTDRNVRIAGIRVLSFGTTAAERDVLKAQVQPGDAFFVDRPNRSDPDFAARYQQMRDTYSNQ